MNAKKQIFPTFINVGPGRCATSWMHEVLSAHPQIGMAKIKETEYFNTNLDKGKNWYLDHFSHLQGKTAIGEISNNYYLDTSIPKKILALNPDMKIIFCIRKPESLLKSYFQFALRRGLEFSGTALDFNTPVGRVMGSGYQVRKQKNKLAVSDKPTLLQSIMLSEYASQYIKDIPNDQLYFFMFEEFKKSPQNLLRELYQFLDVDPDFEPENVSERVNEAIIPKSKLIARFGSSTAFILRRIGAYSLLRQLHQSTLLKKIMYNSAASVSSDKIPNFNPDEATEKRLDEESQRLEKLLKLFHKRKAESA